METSLRQSKTKVEIEGILSSKKLELTTDKEGKKSIKGNLVIKVDELNSISVQVFVTELTTKGEKNKAWDGIQTVMKEYKPIAEVGEAEADRIHTNADFNTYRNQNNQDIVTYRSNFFTRLNRQLDPKRKFTAEVFIKNKYWEKDNNGEETGRLKITGIAPSYNGINILDMVCPISNEYAETFAQDADSLFEMGETFKIDGEVVNSRVEKKVTAALGKVEGDVEYRNELVITGSTPAYEEEVAYPADAINGAIEEYKTTQENMAKQRQNKEDNPYAQEKKPSGNGRTLNW